MKFKFTKMAPFFFLFIVSSFFFFMNKSERTINRIKKLKNVSREEKFKQ